MLSSICRSNLSQNQKVCVPISQILQTERNSCHRSGTVHGKVVGKNPSELKWQKDRKNLSTVGYRGFFVSKHREMVGEE